jgi:hypothetical protein
MFVDNLSCESAGFRAELNLSSMYSPAILQFDAREAQFEIPRKVIWITNFRSVSMDPILPGAHVSQQKLSLGIC